MFRKTLLATISFLIIGCTSKKSVARSKKPRPTVVVVASDGTGKVAKKEAITYENNTANAVVSTALNYTGVRYRFGGETKKGMDCSGLVYRALKEHDISFPRVSYRMAEEGKRIKIQKVQKGDLLFFDTQKRRRRINHVGLVVSVDADEIKFIHATSSRGVIVSSLREGYWNYAFVKATRIL